MATVASFTATPTTVASGDASRLAATFNTDPGTPDQVLNGDLRDPSGASVASVQVTFQGTPPEPTPVVAVGPTPGQWCVVVDSGSLTAVGGNAFDWRP